MVRLTVASFLIVGCAGSLHQGTVTFPADEGRHARFAGRAYAGDVAHGRLVFATHCASCHGAGGRSGGSGPALIDENRREDLAHTIVWIERPYPPMPASYPEPLTEKDVADVAAFVQGIR